MEHLQAQVERSGGEVNTPQEVIDALVTLTRAGLLSWRINRTVRPTFELDADGLTLDHIQDEDEDEVAGYFMHITQEQADAITQAIELEQQDLVAARRWNSKVLFSSDASNKAATAGQ